MEQLSLVLFTVLMQASIGLFIVLGAFSFATKKTSKTLDRAFCFVWIPFAIALLASFTHLGQPFKAFNVFSGIGHKSALSLEIIVTIVFGSFGFLYTVLRYRKMGSVLVLNILLAIASLIGLYLVCVISRVYTLEGVMAWSTILTPLQFYATTLLLGSASATVIVRVLESCPKIAPEDKLLCIPRMGDILISIGIIFSLSLFVAFLIHLSKGAIPFADYHTCLTITRISLTIIGGIFCIIPQFYSNDNNKICPLLVMGGALISLLLAELAGRVLFYDMYYITGM